MPRPSDTFKPGLVRVIISTKMAVMLAMVPSAFPMALGGSSSSGGGVVVVVFVLLWTCASLIENLTA